MKTKEPHINFYQLEIESLKGQVKTLKEQLSVKENIERELRLQIELLNALQSPVKLPF